MSGNVCHARSILSISSKSISSIFVSRISKNYYHNVRNETKGSGGKVEGSRANRDTSGNLSVGNKKLGNQCSSRNRYIFTELIEDVMEEVYKVGGFPNENARRAMI